MFTLQRTPPLLARLPRWFCAILWVAGTAMLAQDASPARQLEKRFESKANPPAGIPYLLYLPSAYQGSEKRWPLMLFLHGSGESGTNLAKVKAHGPPKVVESKSDFPFILVSPQSLGRGWNPELLNELLDQIQHDYRVDPDRVYLTGLSMGGFGTWALAARHPEKFAAVVPICGGGSTNDAPKLAKLPIWVFHGDQDKTVPPERSKAMVEALKAAGGSPRFTLYPEAGHDSWTATYNNPELYDWLLKQKRVP